MSVRQLAVQQFAVQQFAVQQFAVQQLAAQLLGAKTDQAFAAMTAPLAVPSTLSTKDRATAAAGMPCDGS